jgi:hypothetical protein
MNINILIKALCGIAGAGKTFLRCSIYLYDCNVYTILTFLAL